MNRRMWIAVGCMHVRHPEAPAQPGGRNRVKDIVGSPIRVTGDCDGVGMVMLEKCGNVGGY